MAGWWHSVHSSRLSLLRRTISDPTSGGVRRASQHLGTDAQPCYTTPLRTNQRRRYMSKYTYAGDFVNPTADFGVQPNPVGEGYIVVVTETHQSILADLLDGAIDEEEARIRRERMWRPHTNGKVFDEAEDAEQWIESVAEAFEEDYDNYLEENHHAIAQMERYEMWRNEY